MSDIVNKLRKVLSYSTLNPRYFKFSEYYREQLNQEIFAGTVDLKEADRLLKELNAREIQRVPDITYEDLKRMASLLNYNYKNDVLNSMGWVKLGKLNNLCKAFRDNLYPLRHESLFLEVNCPELDEFIKEETDKIEILFNNGDDAYYVEIQRVESLIKGCVRNNKKLSEKGLKELERFIDVYKKVLDNDREVYKELLEIPTIHEHDKVYGTAVYHRIKALKEIVLDRKSPVKVYKAMSEFLTNAYRCGVYTKKQADFLLTFYEGYLSLSDKEGYSFDSLLYYGIFLDTKDEVFILRQTTKNIEDSYKLVEKILHFLDPENIYKEIEKRALFSYDLGIITYSREKSDYLAEHPEDGLEFVEKCIDSMYENGILNETQWLEYFRRIREVLATHDIRHR